MTTKKELKIEEQIRNHYTATDGEWLVEKGKVKEAKLLKEATLEIERLRKELQAQKDKYFDTYCDINAKVEERLAKEKEWFDKRVDKLHQEEQEFRGREEALRKVISAVRYYVD
jgi:hypothetical protein